MVERIRHIEDGRPVHIINNTIFNRHLLQPSDELKELIVGILGHYFDKYDIKVYAYAFLSTHFHLLIKGGSQESISKCMHGIKIKIAHEIRRLYSYEGPVWDGRYKQIPVRDDKSEESVLRYILSHGVKEGLVVSPLDWGGLHCAQNLVNGVLERGKFIDRSRYMRAKYHNKDVMLKHYTYPKTLECSLLTHMSHLSKEEYNKVMKGILDDICEEYRLKRESEKKEVLGMENVLSIDIYTESEKQQFSDDIVPLCDAESEESKIEYRKIYERFVHQYRTARAVFIKRLSRKKAKSSRELFIPGYMNPNLGWFSKRPTSMKKAC